MSDGKQTGTIYDLGYKRYLGTRRLPSTRWRVIMRHQISTAWKRWWRYKMPLGMAVVTAFIAGGFMYVGYEGGRQFRGFAAGSEVSLRFLDGAMPLAIEWFVRAAFVLSLTLGATIIANDTRSNAFTFYFVRSIRPIDYVIGKLMGYGFLVGTLVIVPVLLLCGLRLGFSDSLDDLIAHLDIVPKALGITLLATIVFTAVPLAISSLIGNPRFALALWAAYYMVVGTIATAIARQGIGELGVIDLVPALRQLTYDLFDIRLLRGGLPPISSMALVLGLLAQGALAVFIMWYQVSRDQKTGVGGTS
jgi:hypothetical protein